MCCISACFSLFYRSPKHRENNSTRYAIVNLAFFVRAGAACVDVGGYLQACII